MGQTQESPEALPGEELVDAPVFAGALLAFDALFVLAVLFALGTAATAVLGALLGVSTSV